MSWVRSGRAWKTGETGAAQPASQTPPSLPTAPSVEESSVKESLETDPVEKGVGAPLPPDDVKEGNMAGAQGHCAQAPSCAPPRRQRNGKLKLPRNRSMESVRACTPVGMHAPWGPKARRAGHEAQVLALGYCWDTAGIPLRYHQHRRWRAGWYQHRRWRAIPSCAA
jgi:hypothetical protein